MNYNKVILMGRLTRDPELTLSESGVDICRFGLAINRRRKDPEPDCTTFVDLTAFGNTGAVIGEYLTKGDPIHVEGRLEFQQWGGQSGKAQTKLEVIVDRFEFIGGKKNGDAVESTTPQPAEPASPTPTASSPTGDDVPF